MSRMRIHPATALLLFAAGCKIFGLAPKAVSLDVPWAEKGDGDTKNNSTAPILKAALLEANIVRQPANDLRIRTLVWEELDESGPMSPEQRRQLNHSGFRVGVAGNSAIWALQSLTSEASQVPMSPPSDGGEEDLHNTFQMPVGPAFSLFQRGITRLEVQNAVDSSLIPLDSIRELSDLRDRSHMRCALEIKVEELEDGWALLTVLPQIYSGSAVMRFSVAQNNDRLPERQSVYPLYEQQFQLKLHRGEMAVIGWLKSEAWTPGRLFFQPQNGSAATESLLFIRLRDVHQVRGRSEMAVKTTQRFGW